MALSLKVIPGYQFSENEKLTQTKLNQLGRPTIELQGTIASAAIAPGSITADKLAPGLISGLTYLKPLGKDLVMYQSIDAGGLRQTTINDILALSTPHLDTISTVAFNDYAWIIQAGGDNKKATIGDTLREAISGQTPLAAPIDIDADNDALLLWDATANAGSNPNRQGKVGNVVASYTNRLIEKSNELVGDVEMGVDEVLLRDMSLTAPNQQVRVKIKKLVEQVSQIKAWANINGAQTFASVVTTLWDDTNDVLSSAAVGMQTGEFIWFTTANAIGTMLPWTAYYVELLSGSTKDFRLYKTKAGALAADAAQRVDIPAAPVGKSFFRWNANPIRAGSNISAVIRTGGGTTDRGQFRIFFETPMATINYVVQLTGSYYAGSDNRQGNVCAINVAGADANPKDTLNPATNSFDVSTRALSNEGPSDPDYLSVAVFA